jgi:hypothetical protein
MESGFDCLSIQGLSESNYSRNSSSNEQNMYYNSSIAFKQGRLGVGYQMNEYYFAKMCNIQLLFTMSLILIDEMKALNTCCLP